MTSNLTGKFKGIFQVFFLTDCLLSMFPVFMPCFSLCTLISAQESLHLRCLKISWTFSYHNSCIVYGLAETLMENRKLKLVKPKLGKLTHLPGWGPGSLTLCIQKVLKNLCWTRANTHSGGPIQSMSSSPVVISRQYLYSFNENLPHVNSMLGIVLGTGDARRNKLSSFPKVPDRESKEMEKWTEKCKKYIQKNTMQQWCLCHRPWRSTLLTFKNQMFFRRFDMGLTRYFIGEVLLLFTNTWINKLNVWNFYK